MIAQIKTNLNENNIFRDYNKAENVIKSCTTVEQMGSALCYMNILLDRYAGCMSYPQSVLHAQLQRVYHDHSQKLLES